MERFSRLGDFVFNYISPTSIIVCYSFSPLKYKLWKPKDLVCVSHRCIFLLSGTLKILNKYLLMYRPSKLFWEEILRWWVTEENCDFPTGLGLSTKWNQMRSSYEKATGFCIPLTSLPSLPWLLIKEQNRATGVTHTRCSTNNYSLGLLRWWEEIKQIIYMYLCIIHGCRQ